MIDGNLKMAGSVVVYRCDCGCSRTMVVPLDKQGRAMCVVPLRPQEAMEFSANVFKVTEVGAGGVVGNA